MSTQKYQFVAEPANGDVELRRDLGEIAHGAVAFFESLRAIRCGVFREMRLGGATVLSKTDPTTQWIG